MADSGSSIFSKKAVERLRSPDDLDKYVRVTSPSVWVGLCAVLALSLGLLAWGIFGSVSTAIDATGVSVDGTVICLLSPDDVAQVHEGDMVYVGGKQTKVSEVSTIPISAEEAYEILESDYLVDALMPGKWGYVIHAGNDMGFEEGVPLSVSITTEKVSPLSLVLGDTGGTS